MSAGRWQKIQWSVGEGLSEVCRPAAKVRVGLDYGSCFTKMVLQADGHDGAHVIENGRHYEWPSTVTYIDSKLYFGFEAQERAKRPQAQGYISLKIRMLNPQTFYGPQIALPRRLNAEDLVILSLAYFMLQAEEGASRILNEPAEPQFIVGCPELPHRDGLVLQHFKKLSALALMIFEDLRSNLAGGLDEAIAHGALKRARGRFEVEQHIPERVDIRSEMGGVLVWMLSTPYVAPGRYALLDVGASTSVALTLELAGIEADNRAHKQSLTIFGADRVFKAGDAVDAVFAWAAERGDLSELRGDEPTLWARHKSDFFDELMAVFKSVQATYKSALSPAFEAHGVEGWKEFGLIMVGGGSWIRFMREHMLHRPLPEMLADPSLINSGQPEDLLHADGRRYHGEPDRLAAAYGLSSV